MNKQYFIATYSNTAMITTWRSMYKVLGRAAARDTPNLFPSADRTSPP